MLGTRIADPGGVEGPAGESEGLCLLDIETALAPAKTLRMAAGVERPTGMPVRGYEMHMGRNEGADCARPMLALADGEGARPDGAGSPDGQVLGCDLAWQ